MSKLKLLGGPKVVEECSELMQALMKAAYINPIKDEEDLIRDIEDEIADALGAIYAFVAINGHEGLTVPHINYDRMNERLHKKMQKILKRHKKYDLNGLR